MNLARHLKAIVEKSGPRGEGATKMKVAVMALQLMTIEEQGVRVKVGGAVAPTTTIHYQRRTLFHRLTRTTSHLVVIHHQHGVVDEEGGAEGKGVANIKTTPLPQRP